MSTKTSASSPPRSNAVQAVIPIRSGRVRDESRPLVSVVAPVHDEEECLAALRDRLTQVLQGIGDDYEIVFVDDGSRDQSLPLIQGFQRADPHVGYCSFSRNFGHEAATTCGLRMARGQTVVLIDADLQDPPEVIPSMLDLWADGNDLVYARRRSRDGEGFLTRLTSHLFYRCLRVLAGIDIPVDTGDFRLMDRQVVDAFCRLAERNRFVRGMVAWTGFRQTAVEFDRRPRLAGRTKYHFMNRLRLAFDALCGMSTAPLRGITYLGLVMTALSFLAGAAVTVHKVFFGLAIPGYALLTAGTFFLASVQMLTLGVLGEYLGRIYLEVQLRPLYVVAESRAPRCLNEQPAVPRGLSQPIAGTGRGRQAV